MNYFLYIIKFSNGYLYTGITVNLQKRIKEHKQGLSRPTKNRGKIISIYKEIYRSRHVAALREKEIKGWRRGKK